LYSLWFIVTEKHVFIKQNGKPEKAEYKVSWTSDLHKCLLKYSVKNVGNKLLVKNIGVNCMCIFTSLRDVPFFSKSTLWYENSVTYGWMLSCDIKLIGHILLLLSQWNNSYICPFSQFIVSYCDNTLFTSVVFSQELFMWRIILCLYAKPFLLMCRHLVRQSFDDVSKVAVL